VPFHCPHELHEIIEQPLAHMLPGEHTGDGAEHEPQVQLEVQLSVPQRLQPCMLPGEQTPWPEHVPLVCQFPDALHVWSSVPQLPHFTGLVWPGAQTPAQLAETHV
jgi:hypothetical protein